MLTSGKTYDIIRVWFYTFTIKKNTKGLHYMRLKSGFSAKLLNYVREEFKIDTFLHRRGV